MEREIDPQPVPRYAEHVEIEMATERRTTGNRPVGKRYEISDFEAAGFMADREAFYDMGYRPTLMRMVAHVISVEGPIFDDLLVHPVARAHGFRRGAGSMRQSLSDAQGAALRPGPRVVA